MINTSLIKSDVSGFYLCSYLQVELSQHVLHFVFSAIWDGHHISGPDFTMRGCNIQPTEELTWEKIVMAMVDIICLFCETWFCRLRQKSQVTMIILEFKPKIFWPRFMFPSCCCNDWLLSSLPSRCSCCTYFQKEEMNALEHIILRCYLIHTGKVMKFWKMSLNNILAGIIGLFYHSSEEWSRDMHALWIRVSSCYLGARLLTAYYFCSCYVTSSK